jgi:hypothetical protein
MLRAREKPQSALGLGPSARDTAALAQVLAAEPLHSVREAAIVKSGSVWWERRRHDLFEI